MTYQEAFGEPAAPTAEALADAFLSEYAQTWTGVTWSPRRVRDVVAAIIAAARADERTRLSGEGPRCDTFEQAATKALAIAFHRADGRCSGKYAPECGEECDRFAEGVGPTLAWWLGWYGISARAEEASEDHP